MADSERIAGRATPAGTRRFADRFPTLPGHSAGPTGCGSVVLLLAGGRRCARMRGCVDPGAGKIVEMKTLHAASDRRRPVPLIAAALALVMFSLPALPSLAQVGVTVGPIAGETVGGTTEEHRPLAGGRVMVDMTDNVSIELAIFRFTDQPVEERLGVTVTSDLGITPVQLSARYSHNLVGERFRGFVSGGPGYYFCQDEDVDVEGLRPPIVQTGNPHVKRKNALGWQVAAGLEWLATRNLVVTLEYRFAQMHNSADLTGLSSSTPEGQNAIDDLEGDFEDNDQLGVLDIGVSWRF